DRHRLYLLLPPATPPPAELHTLPLHDALPISTGTCRRGRHCAGARRRPRAPARPGGPARRPASRGTAGATTGWPAWTSWCARPRSEEHTSELQSPCKLVCRLLLEKKKKTNNEL